MPSFCANCRKREYLYLIVNRNLPVVLPLAIEKPSVTRLNAPMAPHLAICKTVGVGRMKQALANFIAFFEYIANVFQAFFIVKHDAA